MGFLIHVKEYASNVDLDQQHSVEKAVHDNIVVRWLAVVVPPSPTR